MRAGLFESLTADSANRLELDPKHVDGPTQELLNLPLVEQERRIEQILMIRKASFRRKACDAYDNSCAITTLGIVNGGGKSEAQSAHIWPVAEGRTRRRAEWHRAFGHGALAFRQTSHLADRRLPDSLSHNKVPSELRTLFSKQMDRIHIPEDARLWPDPPYVARHRERFSSMCRQTFFGFAEEVGFEQ